MRNSTMITLFSCLLAVSSVSANPARVDLRTLTFGTYSCDLTVLVRGTAAVTCPH